MRLVRRITATYLDASPMRVLGVAALLLGAIAFADLATAHISLGFLYLVPIVVASGFLERWQIVLVALACTALRELFGRVQFDPELPMSVLRTFAGFAGSGLFVAELTRNRRLTAEYVQQLERQVALTTEAQEQLAVLIDTSPAAIFIADAGGKVLLANDSAEHLLGFQPGQLVGQLIHPYLPAVETVPVGQGSRSLRSTLECRGLRRNGSMFMAQVWFSTFATPAGPRVAAIVLDASEGLRDREGAGLSSLKRTSRVLIGAVSHSVRNLCAASKVSYANLARRPELSDDEDLKSLGTVIRALESISGSDLERVSDRQTQTVDLHTLLDELRVVIEPAFMEAGIQLEWDIAGIVPPVLGEHYGLLHAFLNLTQNSERALAAAPSRRLSIGARVTAGGVEVSFTDTAGGVQNPERLFQPFAPGSSGSGIGLYVSRAVIRSFDGDLQYESVPGGSRFQVSLRAAYNRSADAFSDGP